MSLPRHEHFSAIAGAQLASREARRRARETADASDVATARASEGLKAMRGHRASARRILLACALVACACSSSAGCSPSSHAAIATNDDSRPNGAGPNGRSSSNDGDSAAHSRPQPSAAATATAAAGPKVAFLGDSISAGLHLPAEQAYPSVLHERLRARGLPFVLLNAGVSGDTTTGGLRRTAWILKQAPEIVVIELGANDSMRGQPIASIEKNLRAIIEKVRDAGATPLLLGMRIPTSFGQAYAAQFEAVYPRIAKDMNVAFVPFFMEGVAGVPDQNLEDGIHPTAAGHIKLAQTCEETLARLVSAASKKAQAGPTTEH